MSAILMTRIMFQTSRWRYNGCVHDEKDFSKEKLAVCRWY
jgi:hypothetical protein